MEETGASFVDQLAEVSRRQGKAFIDPTRIQGFGEEGDPPSPPLPPDPRPVELKSAAELFGGPAVEPAVEPAPTIQASSDELVILEKAASYKQHGVMLTDQERAAIVTVVLKALRRDLDDKFREISGAVPRRKRTVKAKLGRPPKEKTNASV